MNRRGFTLIETVMVIAILGVLMLILVPNVILLINKNNTKSCQSIEDSVKKAAKIYVTNNKYQLGFSCDTAKEITIQTLVDAGDLKLSNNKLVNPASGENIPLNSTIKVTYNCTTKDFSYDFKLNCS